MSQVDMTNSPPPRLGLGTVQFGSAYGVTNKNGKPSDTTVSRIVADALEGEVGLIDTAPVYGDAESRLGALLPDDGDCAIVTKTVSRRHSTQFGKEDSRIVRDGFTASLDRLRRDAIYGLLVHAGSDLLEPGGERLVDTLREFQEAGLVQKIGVSIYDAEELDRILNVFKPEIVQLPLSVADQRLQQSGHLAELKALGVEIHARSVFLQGVLLAEPTMLPTFMGSIVQQLRRTRKAVPDVTPAEFCLAFVRQIPEIDFVLTGAATYEEWRQIRNAFQCCDKVEVDFRMFAIDEPQILNPSNWPEMPS